MQRLLILVTLLILPILASCTRLHLDPNAGAETVFLRTIDHPEDFEIIYLYPPEDGPLREDKNAWTLFWFVPFNHPDLGIWIQETLPENADAANVRANFKTPWYGWPLFFASLTTVHIERVHYEMTPVRFRPLPPPPKEES